MPLDILFPYLNQAEEYRRAVAALRLDDAPVWIEGLAGPAKAAVVAALSRELDRVVLCLTASEDHAERLAADIRSLGFAADEVALYPEGEADLAEPPAHGLTASSVEPERRALARSRLAVLEGLADRRVRCIAAPIQAALRETVRPLAELRVDLRVGEHLSLTSFIQRLADLGYERVTLVDSPGLMAVRGGLLDIWPATRPGPVRMELLGDLVESLREFDPATQRSTGDLLEVTVMPASEAVTAAGSEGEAVTILEHLPAGSIVILDEPGHVHTSWQVSRQARRGGGDGGQAEASLHFDSFFARCRSFRLTFLTLISHSIPWLRKSLGEVTPVRTVLTSGVVETAKGDIPELANRVRSWLAAGNRVMLASDQPHRVAELLVAHDVPSSIDDAGSTDAETRIVRVVHGRLSAGFRFPGIRLVVLSDTEVFGSTRERRKGTAGRAPRKFQDSRPIISLLELKEGDLVVHVTHGIGRYRGLVQRTVAGIPREFLQVDYQDPDRLFVPSDQLDRVQKYIGTEGHAATLHRLGGQEWARTKSKVRARVQEMARELLDLYASRSAARGHAFAEDSVWQEEMEAAFPYRETRDQLRAIWDVKRDMEAPRPMDRLVCGDVGYGKTEVAIRAAFKAVTDGKQVAVLVPTTVLAQQHYNTFTERLAAFPLTIRVLSRFCSRQEIKQTLQGISDGVVDVAIGTHRLLSKDVKFVDLGLLIVDEEQRFGVAHKERLKQLRQSVDVLTLTATPIPRTLNLSLSGLRDMSVIEEPPEGRLAVRTYCLEWDDAVVRDAILHELDRGGQTYFVHNRIETIHRQAERLQKLAPQARIRVGHGQMKDTELEDIMLSFYDGEYDVLVCTTIIESGLDIPNTNTILINNAEHLGLAQLHQLRGRVGRSSNQAYCYLLHTPHRQLTEVAEMRLAAIREFTHLGAGFNLALRDLEIRGAGNLLGGEQSGNMVSVGFDLFCQMIEEAVKELKGESVEEKFLPSASLPIHALLPKEYIPTEGLRIGFYKKIAGCRTLADVEMVQTELEDRFGDPPNPVWNLLALMRLRVDCLSAGVARIETDKESVVLWLARRVDREEARELTRSNRRIQLSSDRLVLYYDGDNPLRPVQNMVKALQRGGGPAAAAAVQAKLAAVDAAGAKR